MNTLRWNKDKLLKAVADKKALDSVYLAIHSEGFISCKELKEKFAKEFSKRHISLTPKATLIEGCNLYDVRATAIKRDGKTVKGYMIGAINRYQF